jgi:hypothetical protein
LESGLRMLSSIIESACALVLLPRL